MPSHGKIKFLKLMTSDIASAGKRLIGHASWTAADHILRLGLTRIVCFPLIARYLGEKEFGAFVVALSIAMIIGGSIAVGLSNFILREVSRLDHKSADRVKRSCVALSFLVTSCAFALLGLLWWLFGIKDETGNTQFWMLVFAAHYVILNPSETALALARLDRNFRKMVLAHLAGAMALLLCVLLFPYLSRWAIVMGIMLWALIPLLLSRGLIPGDGGWLDLDQSKQIIVTSSFFTLSSLIQLASTSMDRLLLAIWWPPEDVASFFAAASLGMLLGTPGLILSQLVLSLLGKATELSRFSSRFLLGYLVANLCLACSLYLIGRPIGKFALELLYPTQAPTALALWDYSVGAAAGTIMVSMLRPFIVKFSPPSYMPILSSAGLLAKVPLLLVLVPSGGMVGAAKALLYGSLIMSLIWMFAFLGVLIRARSSERLAAMDDK